MNCCVTEINELLCMTEINGLLCMTEINDSSQKFNFLGDYSYVWGCGWGVSSGTSNRYRCNSARYWRILMVSFVFFVQLPTDLHDKLK
jgi:hypothetical protein